MWYYIMYATFLFISVWKCPMFSLWQPFVNNQAYSFITIKKCLRRCHPNRITVLGLLLKAAQEVHGHWGLNPEGHGWEVNTPPREHTHPVSQVDGQDGLSPLLQEEDHHEGEGVGRDASLCLTVYVAQLREHTNTQEEWGHKRKTHGDYNAHIYTQGLERGYTKGLPHIKKQKTTHRVPRLGHDRSQICKNENMKETSSAGIRTHIRLRTERWTTARPRGAVLSPNKILKHSICGNSCATFTDTHLHMHFAFTFI